jgi:hypothetical protein
MRRDQLDVERFLPLGGCAPDDGRGRARAPMMSHLPKSAGEQSNPHQALHSRRQLELPRRSCRLPLVVTILLLG